MGVGASSASLPKGAWGWLVCASGAEMQYVPLLRDPPSVRPCLLPSVFSSAAATATPGLLGSDGAMPVFGLVTRAEVVGVFSAPRP